MQSARFEVRIDVVEKTSKKIDELEAKLSRLLHYFQIVAVLLLVVGAGGGFVTISFYQAKSAVETLSTDVANLKSEVAQMSEKLPLEMKIHLDAAKVEFNHYVQTNPVFEAKLASTVKYGSIVRLWNKTGSQDGKDVGNYLDAELEEDVDVETEKKGKDRSRQEWQVQEQIKE